jgi:hypothetical protein
MLIGMAPGRTDARRWLAFALLFGSLSCAFARTHARVEPGTDLGLMAGATVFLPPGTGPDRDNSQTSPFAQVDLHRSGKIGEASGWSFGVKLPLPGVWLGAFDLYGQLPSGTRWAHGLGIELSEAPATYYVFTRDFEKNFATLTLRALAAPQGDRARWLFAANPQVAVGVRGGGHDFFLVVSYVRVLQDNSVQINPGIFDNDETDDDLRHQWLTFGAGLRY